MDRRNFLTKGVAPALAAGFILTKVSEKVDAQTVEYWNNVDPQKMELKLELWGKKGVNDESVDMEVLHRWMMEARIEAMPFDPMKAISKMGPRVKFFPLVDHVRVMADVGVNFWVMRCVGEVMNIPGLLFEVDLGSGKFQDIGFGANFRPQDSGGNEPFWLTDGNTLTLEWGGGRPVAEIG